MERDAEMAVLFADVVNSTGLYRQRGDRVAKSLVADVLNGVAQQARAHHGRVVKYIGDEAMCTFPTADDAARAASSMQRNIVAGDAARKDGLGLRIGFQFGPVLATEDDVHGNTVNLAARIAGCAYIERIVTTPEVVELCSAEIRALARPWHLATLKGFAKEVALVELNWRNRTVESTHRGGGISIEGTALMGDPWSRPAAVELQFSLRCQGIEHHLADAEASLSIGRADGNDIVLHETTERKLSSAHHARIERRGGKIVLVDTSSNGTYVEFDDTRGSGDPFRVKHDELQLRASGRMSFGAQRGDAQVVVAEFVVGAKPAREG